MGRDERVSVSVTLVATSTISSNGDCSVRKVSVSVTHMATSTSLLTMSYILLGFSERTLLWPLQLNGS